MPSPLTLLKHSPLRLFACFLFFRFGCSIVHSGAMPAATSVNKKGKGKKGGKKAVKIVPDPDAAYKQQLDDTLYLPRRARQHAVERYGEAADRAIMAATVDAASLHTEKQRTGPISFVKVPEIIRALGLCVTDDQIAQITAMVAQDNALQGSRPTSVAENATQLSSFADRARLRALLVELLHTHVLAYDPQVLLCPHHRFPTRVSSAVYTANEGDIRSCFVSIWEAAGKKVAVDADGTTSRCVAVEQLEELIASAGREGAAIQALSERELQELYFFVKDPSDGVVREDAFLNCLINV